jgi:hypothetical protein
LLYKLYSPPFSSPSNFLISAKDPRKPADWSFVAAGRTS